MLIKIWLAVMNFWEINFVSQYLKIKVGSGPWKLEPSL